VKVLAKVLWWTCPPLFCLALYWYGLKAWFLTDDFAWLGMHFQVYDVPSFFHAMFAPMAQGTVRPFSERLFFLTFERIFGVDALPFRIFVFLTQFLNLALLAAIVVRITGSRMAGFLAAIFWTANSSLAVAMTWTSSYNQVQCAAFLLGAFYCLLRYIETGRARWNIAQWAIFILGFGSLEINIVYPALAAAYTLFCARKAFLKTLPLFGVSILYAIVHFTYAPKQNSGAYAMHLDGSIFRTLWDYIVWAPGVVRSSPPPTAWEVAGTAVVLLSLAGFAAWRLRHQDWKVLFFLSWFPIVIAPVLPLRDHISDYYLTIPTVGLAMLGGWGFARAWKAGVLWRLAAIAVSAAYIYPSAVQGRIVTAWYYHRSIPIRNLYRAVERAHELHPNKIILLTGVDSELFWAGMNDKPFRLIEATQVYLAPGSELMIEKHPDVGDVNEQVLPREVAGRAIASGSAVVYAVTGNRLTNMTGAFRGQAQQWMSKPVKKLDVGQPYLGDLLGPEWYPIENGYRWMPRRASFRIGGPATAEEKLYLHGFYPKEQLAKAPVRVQVTIDGQSAGELQLGMNDAEFNLGYPLRPELIGKDSLQVEIQVSRAVDDGSSGRELGLAFGVISVK
jgi:hypothetical protein